MHSKRLLAFNHQTMWSKSNDKSQKILFDAMWSNAFKRKANYETKTKSCFECILIIWKGKRKLCIDYNRIVFEKEDFA